MGMDKDGSGRGGAGAAMLHLVQSVKCSAVHTAKCIIKLLFVQENFCDICLQWGYNILRGKSMPRAICTAL